MLMTSIWPCGLVEMSIDYKFSPALPSPESVIELFNISGIGKPNWNPERIRRSMNGSAVVITAWENEKLIGYISVISDLAWAGYITQLCVHPEFQKRGIASTLIDHARNNLGDEVTLVVHSSDAGIKFYEAYGFERYLNVYKLKRVK